MQERRVGKFIVCAGNRGVEQNNDVYLDAVFEAGDYSRVDLSGMPIVTDNAELNQRAVQRIETRNPLRRLYYWVLSWADHRYGPGILAAVAVAESSIFPIPPDPLLMALCLGRPRKSLHFALIASVASVIGGALGYMIGTYLWDAVGAWFLAHIISPTVFAEVGQRYQDNAFLAVFSAAFSPIPYKVFTIAAGVFKVSFPAFIAASILGRSGRFFLVAGLLRLYGRTVEAFIEKHFGWLTLAFVILLVGGFLLFR